MKTYKASQTPGFFDVELRVQWLLAKGNPLSRLEAVMDWESFRPLLEAALARPAKGPGGPRPNDPLKLFKALLVLRHGQIVERGTHDELMALNGLYARLARIQGTTFIEESFEKLAGAE